MLSGSKAFWEDYKDKDKNSSKILADLALRLLSTGASEASCERVFPRMKFIVGQRRFNLKLKRIVSLLRIMSMDHNKKL
ncbi:MAG: hypothetical protein EZS28_046300 [Streblomastix strix]|uniref:HAT C-terminal dimerisation domain-containing protein n=1 Tax=Streblomastix strix TaxID=222440 RepID=A0A5J4TKB4_9EUKA|nr:MAG: hypothetical protein EZS28_046300 [Streblomastix strix]